MKMIPKTMLLATVVAAGFTACEKENGDGKEEVLSKKTTLKVAETQADDTLRVAYNGTLVLSTIFSVDQAESDTAKLIYTLERQPEYAEGNNGQYARVDAYSVAGDKLIAATDKRVPDAVSVANRIRVVREGVLKVSLDSAGSVIDSKTYAIKMTNKPALTPVITLSEELTDVENGTLTLRTTGLPRLITTGSFNIAPIDFGAEDIRIGIGGGDDYITMSPSGTPQAGGSSGTAGTDGFVVAYYKNNTLEEVLTNENLPQAKLYVNVTYVAPTEVVGIAINPEIGATNATKFYSNSTNQRKLPYGFIVLKLNNGETRAYSGSSDSNLGFLAGNFNSYLEGRTAEDIDHSGWWSYVALKAAENVPEVGTTVSFDVTSKLHFGDPEWTVTVTTMTTAAP